MQQCKLTAVKGDVQLDLGYPSQGTITARIEWAGLSNIVRKEKLQLKENFSRTILITGPFFQSK